MAITLDGIKSQVLGKFKKKPKPVKDEDSNERETWGSGLDFFFSALGYAGKQKIYFILIVKRLINYIKM